MTKLYIFVIIILSCTSTEQGGIIISITIKEIAELAGVSRGTVDRVIHNRAGVSQENVDKVNKIIKEYNFKPNTIAKALAEKSKKKKIGIILNCLGNNFFDDVLRGFEVAKNTLNNYDIELDIIKLRGYVPEEQLEAIKEITSRNIHGLIISPINDERIKIALEKLKIPIISCNMDIDFKNKIDYVGCDYKLSGRIAGAAMNLIAYGRSLNVGIVHGSKNIKSHFERYEAFKTVVAENKNVHIIDFFYTEDNNTTAYESTLKMLKQYDIDFVYVVASGIEGVMEALDEYPKRVYAITNDVLPVTVKYLKKDIIKATVYQHPFKQGYNAVAEMVSQLYEGDINTNNYYISSELITKYNIPNNNMEEN